MGANPQPEPEAARANEELAREYEGIQNKLFALKVLVVPVGLLVFLLCGASARLAGGLARRFASVWLVNSLYTAVATFGYAAVFFPLEYYQSFVLEKRYGLLRQRFGGWLLDFCKSLLISTAILVVLVDLVYFLFRAAPATWWVWAALFYALFAVVLSNLYPVLIMPLFHRFEPIEDPDLTRLVTGLVRDTGLKLVGIFRWGLSEKTATANAALAGLGNTRRIILADTLLSDYSADEIASIVAHEVGHYVNRDIWKLLAFGTGLAFGGFYATSCVLGPLAVRMGFAALADIGTLPLFVLCMFLFSLVTMPIANAYSRRLELRADGYAIRQTGRPEAFISAMERLASQNLTQKDPPRWIEVLLHSHPSVARRIRHARESAARAKE
ncbi:MAG: M48 family metallopeptidase [Kiritimatiellae bacterium]|nr:M48 family metallopeptidase [Kiritimatiellia bacterium]